MKVLIGVLIGAAAGYGWHALVGCPGNACPIVANPWTSMAYGAALGGLFTAG